MTVFLKQAVVGYLDLLGVSSTLMEVEPFAGALWARQTEIGIVKQLAQKFVRERGNLDLPLRWASDSCVAWRAVGNTPDLDAFQAAIEAALRDVCVALGIVQCVAASTYCFARGGVAFGQIVEDEFLSGPGLVRAVEIEKYVVNPMVGISGRIAGTALGFIHRGNRYIVLDFPLPHIDYLHFAEDVSDFGDPKYVLAGHAERVHSFVEASRGRDEVSEKARWLLSYHNLHIESRGNYPDLIIHLDPP